MQIRVKEPQYVLHLKERNWIVFFLGAYKKIKREENGELEIKI